MPRLDLFIDPNDAGSRIDAYLADNTPLSRSEIQRLIKEGKVLYNRLNA